MIVLKKYLQMQLNYVRTISVETVFGVSKHDMSITKLPTFKAVSKKSEIFLLGQEFLQNCKSQENV